MRTMKFPLAAAGAALAFASAAVNAQSSAQVFDYRTSTNACAVNDGNTAVSSASCAGNVSGGNGSGSGSANRVARTAATAGSLTQTGAVNSMTALVETRGYVYSSFTLAGTIPTQSYLTFHFDVQELASALAGSGGTPSYDYAFEGLFLNTPSASAWRYQQRFTNGQSYNYFDPSVTSSSSGLDYRMSSTVGAGTYQYFYELATEEYLHASEGPGTTLAASISAHLVGIDLQDAQGNMLATATFDQNGAAILDTTVTPEPASLSLLALGLGVVAVGRRKVGRRAHVPPLES